MTLSDEALIRARASAAAHRAAGEYAEAQRSVPGPPAPDGVERRLHQWALIEPDLSHVRSLRRFGGPITALKRALVRLLGQYHVQLIGDQTRFNVTLLGYVQRLEERIGELERRLQEHEQRPKDPE